MFDQFFGIDDEEDEETPEIHTGTITGVSGIMSGLQTVSFNDRMPVYVENYGVRQLYSASEHMGLKDPVGLRIEFSMDDTSMGMIMQAFQIIGTETHIACYNCQKVIPREDKSEYATCEECGHTYCYPCESEACPFCALKEKIKSGNSSDP